MRARYSKPMPFTGGQIIRTFSDILQDLEIKGDYSYLRETCNAWLRQYGGLQADDCLQILGYSTRLPMAWHGPRSSPKLIREAMEKLPDIVQAARGSWPEDPNQLEELFASMSAHKSRLEDNPELAAWLEQMLVSTDASPDTQPLKD